MLDKLEGRGWIMVEPPEPTDEPSVIARYEGEPIKAGFLMETMEDAADTIHTKYRSGRYDLEVKIDFTVGRGQVRVEGASGYDSA